MQDRLSCDWKFLTYQRRKQRRQKEMVTQLVFSRAQLASLEGTLKWTWRERISQEKLERKVSLINVVLFYNGFPALPLPSKDKNGYSYILLVYSFGQSRHWVRERYVIWDAEYKCNVQNYSEKSFSNFNLKTSKRHVKQKNKKNGAFKWLRLDNKIFPFSCSYLFCP